MKLADLNPFIPKEPKEQALFIETFKCEVYTYRKKPQFWIGLSVALICSLVLISMISTLERLIMLPITFGLALAHDTITSHFTKRLIEARRSPAIDSQAGQAVAPNRSLPPTLDSTSSVRASED